MKIRALRRLCRAVLCLILCCAMSGCMQVTFESASDGETVMLPSPTGTAAQAPTGDSRARYSQRAMLYYLNAEGQLTSALRLIYVYQGDILLQSVLDALLEPPYSTSGLYAVAPEDTRVLSCSLSDGTATVDLSIEALAGGDDAAFWLLRSAIIKTLLAQPNVTGVNVLVEGRACELAGTPLGAATMQDTYPAAAFARWQAEAESYRENSGAYLERQYIAYLPAVQGDVLLPEIHTARFTDTNIAAGLITAFGIVAQSKGYSAEYLPVDLLAQATIETTLAASGKRLLSLRLPEALSAYGEATVSRTVCALALTLGHFLPNIDGIRVWVGSKPLERILLPGAAAVPADGLYRLPALLQATGRTVTLYYPQQNGTLLRVEQAVNDLEPTPRSLLRRLGLSPAEGIAALFPAGTNEGDIMGIRLEDGVAHLNLSATLYAACQSYDENRESAFIYAIINTLVANYDTVSRVQFYVNGDYADLFVNRICIRSPLMANPGVAGARS